MVNANDLQALDRLVRGDCTPTEQAELETRIGCEPALYEQYKLSCLLFQILNERKSGRPQLTPTSPPVVSPDASAGSVFNQVKKRK